MRVPDGVDEALADLDRRLAAHGLEVWVGAEPTFTRRESTEPLWLGVADGEGCEEKLARAAHLAAALAAGRPGAMLHRVIGRHFPEEATPRFCLGLRWPRDPAGAPLPALVDVAATAAALAAAEPAAAPELAPRDAWLTVTPDPGVVEVNTAPCADGVAFLAHLRDIYVAAAAAGLSPLRWRYNGEVTDSGGGGQITLGGPTPAESPFFRHPALLPRLVRYVNDHPSLSYWLLGECAGSASQSPRPDEGVRERWEELRIGCALLERVAARGTLGAELLWGSLAPLLVDAAGNSHRAELNVEKLWSSSLGARGRLGVVELRALRMPPHPEQLAAAAALFRALAARLAIAPYSGPATDWGARLHDEMALPSALRWDLDGVLADLEAHGVGLPAPLAELVGAYRAPALCEAEVLPGVRVSIRQAVEFWPLVGDVASQERAGSRLVDASSERLELRVEVRHPCPGPPEVAIGGSTLPLLPARDDGDARVWLRGLRRRLYVPQSGLHPALPALDPLVVELHGAGAPPTEIRLWGWRPGGGAYDGLPADAEEAARRRAERVAVAPLAREGGPPPPVAGRAGSWTVDLRDVELFPEDNA